MGCTSSSTISSIEGLHLVNKAYSLRELGRGRKSWLSRVAHQYCEKQPGEKKIETKKCVCGEDEEVHLPKQDQKAL